MADIGKKGYSYTGYSEPFFVPSGITVTSGALSGKAMGVNGIAGAVAIEYTEFKNAGLYVRSNETNTGITTFTAKDINFDTRMAAGAGKFIISDDLGEVGTETLNLSNNVTVNSVTYDVATGLYTVVVSSSFDVVAGKVYRVVARQIDAGDATVPAGGFVAGQKVALPVTTTP